MIDKRTMHEASIRVPMVVRYPAKFTANTAIDEQVLSIGLAPTLVELTRAASLPNAQGQSWAQLASGESKDWRSSWLYEYNYEQQFPCTSNVRGVRKGDWKYVQYPRGDGGALRHKSELYNIAKDPGEARNRIDDPALKPLIKELQAELAMLLKQAGANPDTMPIDAGIKTELPEESIR